MLRHKTCELTTSIVKMLSLQSMGREKVDFELYIQYENSIRYSRQAYNHVLANNGDSIIQKRNSSNYE